MITISNFNSVFEVAFAINAILYLFELAPASDGRLERKIKHCRPETYHRHFRASCHHFNEYLNGDFNRPWPLAAAGFLVFDNFNCLVYYYDRSSTFRSSRRRYGRASPFGTAFGKNERFLSFNSDSGCPDAGLQPLAFEIRRRFSTFFLGNDGNNLSDADFSRLA